MAKGNLLVLQNCIQRVKVLKTYSCQELIKLTRCGFSTTTCQQRVRLDMRTVNPLVKNVEYAVRGPIVIKASELEEELSRGVAKPFQRIIKANIGDCQAMGQKPITFIRQVVAACLYPPLIEQNVFPSDVNERSSAILETICGSVGCYSESTGLAIVREHVAAYIEKRDGYSCEPNNLILTNGASSSIKMILELFISHTEKSGALIPIPQYPLYSATLDQFGMHQIGYYLNEEEDWNLDISELKRAIDEGRKYSKPRVLCVINPGNPTGQVYRYDNVKEIIRFCMEEGLVLMVDEVYQDNVYKEGSKFHSFKKVLNEMGAVDGFQMASFHSCSKGFFGECGLRGGYVELLGLDDDLHYQLNKMQSAQLGPNVVGQVVLSCIVNPPAKGGPSYELFMREKYSVLNSLKERAMLVYNELNKIEGISCREVAGAMYAFPRIHLPPMAIQKAEELKQAPDFFYCSRLLEETGICVVPGSGFKQREGTHHFRMTILPPMEELVLFLHKLKVFHENFLCEYGGQCNI